jgi:AcrR family transcriptional regulator
MGPVEKSMTKKINQRAAAKAATRDRAIASAQKLWAEPGSYEAQGIREIAADMGMSTGAVFANFASKADLWVAAFPAAPVPVDSVLTRAAPRLLALLKRELEDGFTAQAYMDGYALVAEIEGR